MKVKYNKAFEERLSQFLKNPLHPQLHNHGLKGILTGYRSINITGDWRAIYSEIKKEDNEVVVIFEMIGTHSQLYK